MRDISHFGSRFYSCMLCAALLFTFVVQSNAAGTGPEIYCANNVYNFGTRDCSEKVVREFVIANRGKSDLKIGTLRGCCGASMEMSEKLIAPGSNAVLKIDLSLSGRSGKLKKSFYVGSNDPLRPYYQLRMIGEVESMVAIEPKRLDFGRIQSDTQAELTVKLRSVTTNLVLNVTNVVMTGKQFDFNISTNNGGYVVKVRTVPELPDGISSGVLVLDTDSARYKRLQIPIIANVTKDLLVVPNRITVTQNVDKPLKRFLAIRSRSGASFSITDVKLPDPDMQVVRSAITGGYRLEISNIVPFEDLDEKFIVINTDHPECSKLAVPFRVLTPEE